jgi:site-specific DNA-methyltransferase (adenine-specific)
MACEIIQGDCLEVMKTFPDNHFSAIVTDPPYSLGFMGKIWDKTLPSMQIWQECLRITKPGGHLLAFGGTRTFHRLTCNIEDAAFEIRDCISWLYGSGFPKSHNHFGIEGYGTALKPAYEPIIMAMKPLDGTFKQNADKWGQAGINIDGCRIGTDDTRAPASKNALGLMNDDGWKCKPMTVGSAKGRWPANVIFDEEAAKMLDEQSGILKSGDIKPHHQFKQEKCLTHGKYNSLSGQSFPSNSGGASRFFYCAKTSSRERNEGLDSLNETKMIRYSEMAQGPTSQQTPRKPVPQKNHHPTVKPLKLMEYLIKLVMPPSNGLLLDPFAGSGTTILASKRLGFEAIGIEKQPEYCEIARARLNYMPEDPQLDMFQGTA